MSFVFEHSLASRASVSVVISLWYHEDIDSLKKVDEYVENDESWIQSPFDQYRYKINSANHIHRLAVHERVTVRVSKLFIPESLKRYLKEFVQIIGENLEGWIEEHYQAPRQIAQVYGYQCFKERFFEITNLLRFENLQGFSKSRVNGVIDVDLRKVLRWNPDGEIDLEQTGEALVRNESDSIKRFRLACAYCREDEMLQLWPSVQVHFSKPEAWDCNLACEMTTLFWWRYFHSFWPNTISAYLFNLDETPSIRGASLLILELVCSCVYSFSNRVSPLTLYLLNKIRLTYVQSVNSRGPEKGVLYKSYGVVFFRAPGSFRAQILRDSPEYVFKQLLFWRHQSFFADTVERSWDIFDDDLFDSVLFHIALGVQKYADSDIYKRIFLWYWTGSPARLRDVERIFYDREVDDSGTTLRHFVGLLFGHSPEAEDRMRRILFGGRHVIELATRVRTLNVLSHLVHTCLLPEEWEEKLDLLDEHFAAKSNPCARIRDSCCIIS